VKAYRVSNSLARTAGLALAAVIASTLPAGPAAAQSKLTGTVLNGTTNRPVAQQKVQLLLGGEGMREIASAETDASGRFSLLQPRNEAAAFFMVQTVFQGVNYRARVQGDAPAQLTVFEAAESLPDLHIRSARVVVEAAGNRARVQEFFGIENPSNPPRSLVNSGGTFRFRLGKKVESPTAAVLGAMNMPIPVAIQDGPGEGDLYINHALQPGLTVVMLAYEADYGSEPLAVESSVPYPIARAELLVAPASLEVKSPVFQDAGVDSSTGLKKYEAGQLAAGTLLAATLSGEAPAEAVASAAREGEVRTEPNSLARSGLLLTACILLLLLWALGVRAAKEWNAVRDQLPQGASRKEIEKKLDDLVQSIADLDDLRETGKVADKDYWKERLELKAKVVAILRQIPPALAESYANRNASR
jgi:5-hydroxyisourate hydrolase-like protein (transthyretin family)